MYAMTKTVFIYSVIRICLVYVDERTNCYDEFLINIFFQLLRLIWNAW